MTGGSPIGVETGGAVAVVTMADREGRNTFTPEFTGGLVTAMAQAVAAPTTRVVLVRGLPELFCAGGTQRELRAFADGRGSFDTDDFFREFARCPLPVVASVQGHAIGGGLVLALYADLAVFSLRSVYAANFMRYGFTPGMGATDVLPRKLGRVLGTELLWSARNYRGAELARRHAPLDIVAHDEVPARAFELAESVAAAPRTSLELLKAELSGELLRSTTDAIAAEARMHRTTFRLPEVAQRIREAYGRPPAPTTTEATH